MNFYYSRLFLGAAYVFSTACSAESLSVAVGAKSFILPISSSDCQGFGEALFRAVTNCTMTDNPTSSDVVAKDFRLSSQIQVKATCLSEKISSWSVGPVKAAFGTEGPLVATGALHGPLVVKPTKEGSTPTPSVSFKYTLKGRPHSAAEALFVATKPDKQRTCRDIWHTVAGTITCKEKQPVIDVRLEGSQFPSHRLWVGQSLKSELKQGPVQALWSCANSDPSLIK